MLPDGDRAATELKNVAAEFGGGHDEDLECLDLKFAGRAGQRDLREVLSSLSPVAAEVFVTVSLDELIRTGLFLHFAAGEPARGAAYYECAEQILHAVNDMPERDWSTYIDAAREGFWAPVVQPTRSLDWHRQQVARVLRAARAGELRIAAVVPEERSPSSISALPQREASEERVFSVPAPFAFTILVAAVQHGLVADVWLGDPAKAMRFYGAANQVAPLCPPGDTPAFAKDQLEARCVGAGDTRSTWPRTKDGQLLYSNGRDPGFLVSYQAIVDEALYQTCVGDKRAGQTLRTAHSLAGGFDGSTAWVHQRRLNDILEDVEGKHEERSNP